MGRSRLALPVVFVLLTAACIGQPPSRLPAGAAGFTLADAAAEVVRLSGQVVPINSPLEISYRPSALVPMRMEISAVMGGKSVGMTVTSAVQIARRGAQLSYESEIYSMSAGDQKWACGSLPIMRMSASVTSTGDLGSFTSAPGQSCEQSDVVNRAMALSRADPGTLWKFPPDGVKSGTMLDMASNEQGSRLPDRARAVVLGQSYWAARPALAVQLIGCTRLTQEAQICPSGIAYLDLASGLPLGGVVAVDYKGPGLINSVVMRMTPD